jgi:hypothetical protein
MSWNCHGDERLLGNAIRKYVMGDRKNGYNKQTQNVYNSRIRNYAVQALKDLALLAEKLPEKQQAQIFNEDTLAPLALGILRFQTVQQIDEKEARERQSRILSLCYLVLNEVGYREKAWSSARDIMGILVMSGSSETADTITGLRAVYLKGFSKQQKPLTSHA